MWDVLIRNRYKGGFVLALLLPLVGRGTDVTLAWEEAWWPSVSYVIIFSEYGQLTALRVVVTTTKATFPLGDNKTYFASVAATNESDAVNAPSNFLVFDTNTEQATQPRRLPPLCAAQT